MYVSSLKKKKKGFCLAHMVGVRNLYWSVCFLEVHPYVITDPSPTQKDPDIPTVFLSVA